MSWIKRNLYFLIGTLVALLLMGAAGWYLYSQWQVYGENREKLNKDYELLASLNKQNPHPGARDINNITNAQGQAREWGALGDRLREGFGKIPPIPESPDLTDQAFSAALSRTISQLQREATNSSVALLTPNYSFSFEAQNQKMSFAPGSLPLLAVQLGEVKALTDVLFKAKINSLVSIKRERVSVDDQAGNAADYVAGTSKTNEQAVLTPYLLTFHCFSPELAAVLAGFANAPQGYLIESINVTRGAPATLATDLAAPAPMVAAMPQPAPVSAANAAAVQRANEQAAREAMARRYGTGPGGGRGMRGGEAPFRRPAPIAPTPTPGLNPTPSPARTGPVIVLDEGQLKVEMLVQIVKVLEPKKAAGPAPRKPGK
jgi:hypothetical protein